MRNSDIPDVHPVADVGCRGLFWVDQGFVESRVRFVQRVDVIYFVNCWLHENDKLGGSETPNVVAIDGKLTPKI